MAILGAWFEENWFSLLQSVGIVGSLFFTAWSMWRDANARKITDFLALTQQHRELWATLDDRPELRRVVAHDVDLIAAPITEAEQHFLNSVIVHFNMGWLLARSGSLLGMEGLRRDVRAFFRRPLPEAVWNETKKARDPEFVRFIESCLRRQKRSEDCLTAQSSKP